MNTRMSKYDEDKETVPTSRVKRNANLYNEINNTEIEDFTLRSNATVLGRQDEKIDIEKIKKILDTKYNEVPKRKSIRLEPETVEKEENVSPTKEYDLNIILDKAKEEKEESYEEVRAKRLRDTQFDILKNLNISEEKDEEEVKEQHIERPEDNDLLNLINTITINEEKEKKSVEGENEKEEVKEEKLEDNLLEQQEKALDEKDEKVSNSIDEIKNEIKKVENTSPVINNDLDNSFYTKSNIFKKKDFSSEDDEDDKLSIWVKILIFITIIGIAIGMYFFIKSIIGF